MFGGLGVTSAGTCAGHVCQVLGHRKTRSRSIRVACEARFGGNDQIPRLFGRGDLWVLQQSFCLAGLEVPKMAWVVVPEISAILALPRSAGPAK